MGDERRHRAGPDIRREFKRLSGGLSYFEYTNLYGKRAADKLQAKASANVR